MPLLVLSSTELKGLLILTLLGCSVVTTGWLYLYFGPCKTRLDLLFLVDTSQSVTDSDLASVTHFCKEVISNKNIHLNEETAVRIGFSRFSLRAEWLNSSFDFMTSKNEMDQVMKTVNSTDNRYLRINTNTSAALEFINAKVYNKTRKNSRKTVIMITDGVSDVRNIFPNGTCKDLKIRDKRGRMVCKRTLIPESILKSQTTDLSNKGFSIIAVQIGDQAKSQLLSITSNVYRVDDYNALGSITDELSKGFCRKSWWVILIPGIFTAALVLVKIWLGYAEVKALDKATIENVHCVGNL